MKLVIQKEMTELIINTALLQCGTRPSDSAREGTVGSIPEADI